MIGCKQTSCFRELHSHIEPLILVLELNSPYKYTPIAALGARKSLRVTHPSSLQ